VTFNQTFGYDNANRLMSATDSGGWSRNFGYDAYGNMWVAGNTGVILAGNTPTSQSQFTSNNQIAGNAYDAACNLLSVNGNTANYDAENQLVQVTEAPAYGGAVENLAYDGSGQRVEKLVPSAMSVYVYDAFGALAAQYSSSANAAACTTCYLSTDHLGSVRLVTDQNGIVVARHDYLPFGEEIPASTVGRNGQWGSTTDVAGKFTGQVRDSETGLDFFNARYFGAALGRFTSPDPANAGADPADPQTWNGYGYVRGNPMALTDPTGMWDIGGWDDGGGCDWFDPLCWPVSPCFFFDCVGGGSSGGGSHGSGDSGGTVSNTPKSTPMPPNSFPGGETLGLPPGMRVPLPSPAVLLGLGLNLDCEFGVCVPGLGPMGAEPSTQIQSLYKNILEHLQWIAKEPYNTNVPHWETEIRTWVDEISKKATKVTLKRRPGALNKYLQRTIGITLEDLQNLLPSPVIVVNPCIVNPRMPFCGPVSPGVPPIA
jgi:RHS repeat-associated protein